MKKIFLLLLSMFLFSGCSFFNEKNILSKVENKVNNLNSYNLKGNLEIFNGEDTYNYNLDISFKKDNFFKVSLKNIVNNHEQIILKNNEGVFVVTPSLNKSFKFQSDWPYNNSQIYLWQTIIKDLKNDPNCKTEKVDDSYVLYSTVNYANNSELIKQKVYIDNSLNIVKVEILNNEDVVQMAVNFTDFDLKPIFDDDYFAINSLESSISENENDKSVFDLDSIIYPMYLPSNTHLVSQNKLSFQNGERVLMTFEGESSFMLIQETVIPSSKIDITPMYGEPILIGDFVGAYNDSSITWLSNGVEYYLTSDTIGSNELINIAKSINIISVGK